jgi:tripartite-type tricarboxylate transporter receptor subunit TctC
VRYLKANPKKLTSGSNGRGTSGHLAIELFNQMAGVEVRYIPYRTSPQAQADLLSGTLSMMVTSTMSANVNAGTVRPIAVTILKRWDIMPNVPTFDELGLKGFESVSWTSLFAPKGTPAPIVERINVAIKAALADPALRERLNQAGVLLPEETGPVFFDQYLRQEMKKWGDLLRSLPD